MNNTRQLRVALLLGGLSFFGGFTVYLIIEDLLGISAGVMMEKTGLPLAGIALMGGLQTGVLSFLLAWAGLRLGRGIGLGAPLLHRMLYRNTGQETEKEKVRFSSRWAWTGVAGAVIGSLIIILLDRFAFRPFIPALEGADEPAVWWKGAMTVFYGGIVEEVQVRLFLMTLITWCLIKIFARRKPSVPPAYYWIAITAAAVLFGLLHLPATAQAFGPLTLLIVLRAVVLNSLLGIFFGYLFWRKGLEYAMLSHMTADLCLHAVFVHLFR